MDYIEDESVAADVCEIIEALEYPSYTNSTDELIELVRRTAGALGSADFLDLLTSAEGVFQRRRGMTSEDFFFSSSRNKTANDIAAGLRDRLPFWPYFVYHGTSSKALPSVLENGLMPGFGRSRWKGIVEDEYLSCGVFLTTSWRTALSWAESNALTKNHEFRKDGSLPVIVRIPAEHLELYHDRRARSPGCLICPNRIDVASADVFLMDSKGGPANLPIWEPLHQMSPSAAHRRESGLKAPTEPKIKTRDPGAISPATPLARY